MVDIGEMLLKDIEIIKEEIPYLELSELQELQGDIREAIEELNRLEAFIRETIKAKQLVELEEEEVEKEYKEKEEVIEEELKKKQLPVEELITVALAQKPKAPEYIKEKAKEIIERYELTEEEVKRIYNWIFG